MQKEIKLVHRGHTTIDNSPRLGIAILGRVGNLRGEETSVVSLATDDDRELWVIIGKFPESGLDGWHFLGDDNRELALQNRVSTQEGQSST